MNPGAFTLRELIAMAEARQHDLWNYASATMALLANIHRDPKKGRAFKPLDFHPLAHAQRHMRSDPLPLKADISVLKTVFIDNQPAQREA